MVAKIEFEDGNRSAGEVTATGVRFLVDGTTHTVKASKEVIVCGGVINSPQILELSGIGSSELLKKIGIDVVVNNKGVGENLNDHTACGISFVRQL